LKSNTNLGYCTCCRQETVFEILGDWLRDQYLCTKCGSIPRQRHVNLILDKYFTGWETLRVHESSPSNHFVARWSTQYTFSHYIEHAAEGSIINGIRSENLEALTFRDNSFNLIITQDVLEHVFHPDRAMREIMRVLIPGGAHVFTTPKHSAIRNSYRRSAVDTKGNIEYLKEAVYHSNPVGDGKALVTWDYGNDFEFLIWEWSGYQTCTYITRDRSLGLDGEFLEVFVTRKLHRSQSPVAQGTSI